MANTAIIRIPNISFGGDLSGTSSSQTVIGIDGTPIVITSLTTGNGLSYNGTDWVNAPLNLAGGAHYVTGVLPAANMTAQALTATQIAYGNASNVLTGTSDFTWVDGYQTLGVGSTAAASTIAFGALVTVPTIQQNTPTSDVATVDMIIAPQAPYASAATNVKGGNLRVNLSAPLSGTGEAALVVYRGASGLAALGPLPGAATTGALWLTAGATRGANAETLSYDGTTLNIWSQGYAGIRMTGQNQYFQRGGTPMAANDNGYFWFGAAGATVSNGGGAYVIGISPATTNPTTNPGSSGVILYVDKNDLNLKSWDANGTVTSMAPKSTGTVNTQAQKIPTFFQYGRIASSTGTLTLTIPLATSTTNCTLYFEALAKIATAGSGTTVGDSFLAQTTKALFIKNVGGTLTATGSGTIVNDGDSDLTGGSSAAVSLSGTNIIITLTITCASGTLGNADCSIYAKQIIN